MTGRGSGVPGRAGTGSTPPELPVWQLVLRFVLELAALVAWGLAGWELTGDALGGWLRWLVALVLVSLAAGAWGTFRVDGDSGGESKEAPVRVPGAVRLVLELVVLLGGAVAVTWAGVTAFGVVLGVLVVFHYATTMRRTTWLLAQ